MLELTAEAINNHSILRTTKRFYLRDIGKLSETNTLKAFSRRLSRLNRETASFAKVTVCVFHKVQK